MPDVDCCLQQSPKCKGRAYVVTHAHVWHKSQAQLHPDHRRPKGVGRVARAPRAVGHDGLAPLGRNGRHGGGLQLREARDEARDDLGSVCREVVVLARVFLDVEEARRLRRQGATAT